MRLLCFYACLFNSRRPNREAIIDWLTSLQGIRVAPASWRNDASAAAIEFRELHREVVDLVSISLRRWPKRAAFPARKANYLRN